METLNGIEIKRQDLKKEKGQYVFFRQLEDLIKKNEQKLHTPLNDALFDRFDGLVITKKDELMVIKGEEFHVLATIKGAFETAQALFDE